MLSSLLRRLNRALFRPRLGFMVSVPVVLATVALAAPSSALATSGVKCANNGTYGSSCIDVHGSGLQVQDIQAWFTPPNRDYLTNRTWSTELTSYGCDPIGRTKPQCPPGHTYYSKSRRGNPPVDGSTCISLSGKGLTYQQCEDYGVAYADGDDGDWPGYFRFPHTYSGTTWLCVELAIRNGKRWVDNGPAGSKGVRGCAEVKG